MQFIASQIRGLPGLPSPGSDPNPFLQPDKVQPSAPWIWTAPAVGHTREPWHLRGNNLNLRIAIVQPDREDARHRIGLERCIHRECRVVRGRGHIKCIRTYRHRKIVTGTLVTYPTK